MFCGTPAFNVGNAPVMAANALPATPLALSNNPAIPPIAPLAIPPNAPAILLNPPVTVLAKLPAKLPADTKLLADPNTLFNAPVAAPTTFDTAPLTAPKADLAALLTKLTVFCTPAVAADITKPAIAVPDSFPVISPVCVNADCACCIVCTAPATCAPGLFT